MKILQVNCVHKKGSTGKITYDIHTALKEKGIESIICYGRGVASSENHVYKTCSEVYSKLNNLLSRFTGIMYGGCFFSTKRLIHIIKKEKPDVVHLQCINGYFVNIYRLVTWLKTNQIKTVLTLHAEFMYTGGCSHALECTQWCDGDGCGTERHCPRYKEETKSLFFDGTRCMWLKMKKAFVGFEENLVVISVSPWLKERAERSIILSGLRHEIIFNGLDDSVFYYYGDEQCRILKRELGITNSIVVFYATTYFNDAIGHIKGGYYLIDLAKKLPDITFVVAGDYSRLMKLPSNIVLVGKINNQIKLAQLYAMANATVLTSKRETFSMVTAESLCCGTPVVGFKAGGPESIAISEYSKFVVHGDVDALADNLKSMLAKEIDKEKVSELGRDVYSKGKMVDSYIDVYQRV